MSECHIKSLLIDHIEAILKNNFTEAIRSDSPYTDDGNLTFLQNVIEKKAPSVDSYKKVALSGKSKTPHDIIIKKSCHGKVYV